MGKNIERPGSGVNTLEETEKDWAQEARTAPFLSELFKEVGKLDGDPNNTTVEEVVQFFLTLKPEEQRRIDRMTQEYLDSDSNDPVLEQFAQALLDLPNKYQE